MYAIAYKGRAIGPSGEIKDINGVPLGAENVAEYNKALEDHEIEHIKTGPDRLFLYVTKKPMTKDGSYQWRVTTWLGTDLGQGFCGERKYMGYNRAYRRAITVRLFGVLYHGWYMESSGNYCRLRKAKRQE